MGGDIDGQKRLTILSLCDFLQELLIENDMQDLPVTIRDYGYYNNLYLVRNAQVTTQQDTTFNQLVVVIG